jgi:hypothetical protein
MSDFEPCAMETSEHTAHHNLTKHVFLREYSTKLATPEIGKDKGLNE